MCRLPNSSRTPETTAHETNDVRARSALSEPGFRDAEICPGLLRCATAPVIAFFSETKAVLRNLSFSAAFRYEFFQASGNLSIRCETVEQGAARRPPPYIVSMSFRPDIPWQVALQHCLPPLHRLLLILRQTYPSVDGFSSNGDNPLNFVSHPRGSVHLLPFSAFIPTSLTLTTGGRDWDLRAELYLTTAERRPIAS
jgi:hypothetical protein